MVSDLRKKKLVHVFKKYFDFDNSGYINIKDCDIYITKLAKHLDLKPGDAKYKELKDQWHEIWEGMIRDIDVDRDGELCLAEWVAYWEKMAKDPNMKPEWFEMFSRIAYNAVIDANIGEITIDSYVACLSIYDVDPKEAAEAFRKFSRGKEHIEFSEYQHLWREFFTSDDPNAPGNFLAGKASF